MAHMCAKISLLVYTLVRIAANLACFYSMLGILHEDFGTGSWMQQLLVYQSEPEAVIDMIARPLINALGIYCFLGRQDRLDGGENAQLQLWSWRSVLCTGLFFTDESVMYGLFLGNSSGWLQVPLETLLLVMLTVTTAFQLYTMALKLSVLDLTYSARLSKWCTLAITAVSLIWAVVDTSLLISHQEENMVPMVPLANQTFTDFPEGFPLPDPGAIPGDIPGDFPQESPPTPGMPEHTGPPVNGQIEISIAEASDLYAAQYQLYDLRSNWQRTSLSFLCLGVFQSLCLCSLSYRVCTSKSKQVSKNRVLAYCLMTNCLLLIGGIILSYYLRFLFRIVSRFFLTIDLGAKMLNSLLLSGMIGPRQWNHPMERFHDLAAGLANKRIAFPGAVHPGVQNCIVSFPGKYSQEWDESVDVAKFEESVFSLACVFLTDSASGLGKHCENPETPGKCWCHCIYPGFPPQAYLSILDLREVEMDEQELIFRKADTEAMGQILLIRKEQTEAAWEEEVAQAMEKAAVIFEETGGTAPWGCEWFEDWKKNVDQAVALGQTLHVFYFEKKVGQGKVSWDDLTNPAVIQEARKNTGLGASQTAEVAYLEKMKISYIEHDVTNFHSFITKCHDHVVMKPEPARIGVSIERNDVDIELDENEHDI